MIPILFSMFRQSWKNPFTGKCYLSFGLQHHLQLLFEPYQQGNIKLILRCQFTQHFWRPLGPKGQFSRFQKLWNHILTHTWAGLITIFSKLCINTIRIFFFYKNMSNLLFLHICPDNILFSLGIIFSLKTYVLRCSSIQICLCCVYFILKSTTNPQTNYFPWKLGLSWGI